MERDMKRFSSMGARRYFGVKTRRNHDDDQKEDVTVGMRNEEFAESQFYPPPAQQLVPSSGPEVRGVPSKKLWSKVMWEKIDPVYEIGNDTVRPRHGHRAVAFGDLIVVFSGGNEGIFQEINVYCTKTNRWFKPPLKGEVPPGKASYGAAIVDGHKLLIFGGMEEEQPFSKTLYECNLQTWEWKLLKPCGRTAVEKPEGRIGHSFTEVYGRIFMFGGLRRVTDQTCRTFVDWTQDLYVLYPKLNEQQGLWEKPTTFGNLPSPRESHAAVKYVSKNSADIKLIIFGGTGNVRLGDIHSLDINTMMWTQIEAVFTPRSLHTATLVGDRVYIFGGWIGSEIGSDDVSYQLMCFNLAILDWELACFTHVETVEPSEDSAKLSPAPVGRAGHSAVAIDERIYVWSGRYGWERVDGKQICLDDFWMLNVSQGGRDRIYFPQIMADGQLALPVDLSLVKNELPDVSPSDEPMDYPMMSIMSTSDVKQALELFEVGVVNQKEQLSQNRWTPQTQELSAASTCQSETSNFPQQPTPSPRKRRKKKSGRFNKIQSQTK